MVLPLTYCVWFTTEASPLFCRLLKSKMCHKFFKLIIVLSDKSFCELSEEFYLSKCSFMEKVPVSCYVVFQKASP